jgi:hypothetical protein
VVVALKSRTIAPEEAVAQSLAALRWLQAQGAQQIYFKYCSTFDSSYTGDTRGNIGPVTEALMDALGTDFTVATPAFPDNQRTVFKGYLFVGDVLLSESGMRNHPLTPMLDANLVRVLQAQCQRLVGLLDYTVVAQGEVAIAQRIAAVTPTRRWHRHCGCLVECRFAGARARTGQVASADGWFRTGHRIASQLFDFTARECQRVARCNRLRGSGIWQLLGCDQ